MKYEILKDRFIKMEERKLYRIRALKDGEHFTKGEIGGYVESEENLSQDGECWVGDEAKVFGNARVFHDALILGRAEVFESA